MEHGSNNSSRPGRFGASGRIRLPWGKDFNVVPLIIFLLVTWRLPFIHTFEDDTNCWGRWSAHILKYGLAEAYGSDTNYMPLYQYVLWAFGNLAGSEAAIWQSLPYLRCVTLAFDFAGIWIIWKWMAGRMAFNTLLYCCMINVAFWYNTVLWGQVDSIEAALAVASLYAAFKGKAVLSGLLWVLALNMKLQAIIFLPVWALLIMPMIVSTRGRRQLLIMTGAMAALQGLILWPFVYGAGGLRMVWQVPANAVAHISGLSANAYNWWYWITAGYPGNVPDNAIAWLGLTYKQWGYAAFFSLSAIALWPLMVITYRRLKGKTIAFTEDDAKCIWLTSALVCLLFFFCNTEMHERYVHPAVLFLTAYAFKYRTFWLYALFSIAYLINIEEAINWLQLPDYGRLISDGRYVAVIYAVVIAGLFMTLYANHKSVLKPDKQIAYRATL